MRSFYSVIVALWLIGYSDCKSQPPSSLTFAPELVQASGLECPRQTGYFKHEDPTNCKEFYECVDGISTLHKCPEGLQFNEFNRYCEWAFSGLRQGCVEKLDDDDTTWNGVLCVNRGGTVKAKCLTKHGSSVDRCPHKWCYTGDQTKDWDYCTGACTTHDKKDEGIFLKKHKCIQIPKGKKENACRTDQEALNFVRDLKPKVPVGHIYTLFNNPGKDFQIARIQSDKTPSVKEDVCIINKYVQSWTCNWHNNNKDGTWTHCTDKGKCKGGFTVIGGHFASESYVCQ